MVTVREGKIVLPTYQEPAAEEMPMFAENRVHQRTSGNPYPITLYWKLIANTKKKKNTSVSAWKMNI